jgi:hypothetical protein
MYVNGISFLLSVSEGLGLLMVSELKSKNVSAMKPILDQMINYYRSSGFSVKFIKTDGEGAVVALSSYLNGRGIKVNSTGKSQHVPQIERKIRQVKERVRSHISVLPFKLTKQMLLQLVLFCVQSINIIPQNTNDSKLSPKEMFTGRKLDYSRDMRISFGEYCQIHEDNEVGKNSMSERTADAIAIKMKGNLQGTAEFLSLSTWKIVSRDKWTALPMPRTVIEKINLKAENEKSNFTAENIDVVVIGNESIDQQISQELVVANDQEVASLMNAENNLRLIPTSELFDLVIASEDVLNSPLEVVDNTVEIETIESAEENKISYNNVSTEDKESEDYVSESFVNSEVNNQLEISSELFQPIIDVSEVKIDENSLKLNLRENRAKPGRWSQGKTNFVGVHQHQKIQETVKDFGYDGLAAVVKELKQLMKKGVFEAVNLDSIPRNKKGKHDFIKSRMLLKKKRDDTMKARLAAGGHLQDKSIYDVFEELNSPTVSGESTSMVIAIGASEKRNIVLVDIVGAYLNATMEREVYMEIEEYLTKILVELHPELTKYVSENGCLYVKLIKALYGCIESAKLFYKHLSTTLFNFGFIQNSYDNCIFNYYENGIQCTIAAHVDDLLITCIDNAIIEKVLFHLEKVYKEITINKGTEHSYLGMNLLFKDGLCILDMESSIEKIIKEYGITGTSATPAIDSLFVVNDDDELLNESEKGKFHTFTAKLLYLARKARPDILTTVSFLTTRVSKPNVNDKIKLERLLKYVSFTKSLKVTLGNVFNVDNSITIKCYIDTSHGIHDDFRGHVGSIFTIGQAKITCRSTKMKLNTKGTAETELVGMSEEMPQGLWMKYWLECNGHKVNPIIIFQDNKSTITMINKGKPCSKNTRHIKIRYFFIKDYIDKNEIVVKYLNTDDMLADILTKPLVGIKFKKFCSELMNCV